MLKRSEDTILNLQNERLFMTQEIALMKTQAKKLGKNYT